MEKQSNDFIPGYWISAAEGTAAGAIGYASVWTGQNIGYLFGRTMTNLTPIGTGIYSGGGTVLHTLLMEDFEGLRNFIKNRLPVDHSIGLFAIDAAASTAILSSFAAAACGLGYAIGSPLTLEDAMQITCITQASNLAVNHGLPAAYNLFTKIVKSQLGIKDD
jgi:hypothetical protein